MRNEIYLRRRNKVVLPPSASTPAVTGMGAALAAWLAAPRAATPDLGSTPAPAADALFAASEDEAGLLPSGHIASINKNIEPLGYPAER